MVVNRNNGSLGGRGMIWVMIDGMKGECRGGAGGSVRRYVLSVETESFVAPKGTNERIKHDSTVEVVSCYD